MKPKLVIWGASGHARVVAEIVRLLDRYEIVGFIDDIHPERLGSTFAGSRIIGSNELDILSSQGVEAVFIAVGDCHHRMRLAQLSGQKKFSFPTFVHPHVVLGLEMTIGEGTVIMAGSIIGTGTSIGRNVIINTSASIDHDCVLGDGVHIGPGVHIAGHVEVGDETFIGIGSAVRDHLKIGRQTTIGAGSVVVKNLPDAVLAFGVPARVIKNISNTYNL